MVKDICDEIFDKATNYLLKHQDSYYDTSINEFGFYFDIGANISSYDYENNNFIIEANAPLIIKITNNTVKIGFTEI